MKLMIWLIATYIEGCLYIAKFAELCVDFLVFVISGISGMLARRSNAI